MPTAYAGEVEIEDNDFTMEFERFIIRDGEVAFQGGGYDEEGEFHFEGKGEKNEAGQYRAEIKLVYPGWRSREAYQGDKVWEGKGMIVIENIEEFPKKKKCIIQGIWLQDGDRWKLNGELNVIKT